MAFFCKPYEVNNLNTAISIHPELRDPEAYEVKTEATEVLDFKITFVRVHGVNILV